MRRTTLQTILAPLTLLSLGTHLLPEHAIASECRDTTTATQGSTNTQYPVSTSDRGVPLLASSSAQEEIIPLDDSDPNAESNAQLRAEYAMRLVESYLGENADAASELDTSELQALIDGYAAVAWQRAGDWVSAIDHSEVPLALVKPKYECQKQVGCESTDACSYDGYKGLAYCVVTSCGEGACPTCPSIFNLDKLVVRGWCSYTCMLGEQIVGIKVRVLIALNGEFSKCLKLEKPVPCEGTCKP